MPTKILVVDDDASFLNAVVEYLASRSFATIQAGHGNDGLLLARDSKPDMLLIDSDLPGLSGHEVCRLLKQQAETAGLPIIIMSGARTKDKDVLAGFEGGADDYISKPFAMPVLVARIQAVLRRYMISAAMGSTLKKCGIELDAAARVATAAGKPVRLTRKEFDLLATLLSKPGRALNPTYLLETVWGYDPGDYNDPSTVEVHISTLRKKLGTKFAKHIVSVTGHGYKFQE